MKIKAVTGRRTQNRSGEDRCTALESPEQTSFRVPPQGGTPEVYAAGFTAIIDVAFGPDGSLYVLELAKNGLLDAFILNDWTGALIRIAPDGTRTEIAEGEFFAPGAVVVGPDGTLYVSNNSIFSGTGEVLQIKP